MQVRVAVGAHGPQGLLVGQQQQDIGPIRLGCVFASDGTIERYQQQKDKTRGQETTGGCLHFARLQDQISGGTSASPSCCNGNASHYCIA
jgi:hypothetical protein